MEIEIKFIEPVETPEIIALKKQIEDFEKQLWYEIGIPKKEEQCAIQPTYEEYRNANYLFLENKTRIELYKRLVELINFSDSVKILTTY